MTVPEGWILTTLEEISDLLGGTTPSKSEPEYWGGSNYWATPSDITALPSGTIHINGTSSCISDTAVNGTSVNMLPPNSVLMTSRATIGWTAINTEPMSTNQGFCNFIPYEKVSSLFLAYWLRWKKPLMERLAAGSTFKEISKRSVRKIEISLPPLPEQKKIAEILSSVDEAIQATQETIEQTKRVKKGLLQDLLTKGIGHTRFKETEIGMIPEEWEVTKLDEISILITKGTTPTSYGYSYKNNGIIFLRVENITEQGIISLDNTKFIDEETNSALKRSQLKEDDLLISIAGAIGRSAIVKKEHIPANTNQAISLVRLCSDSVLPEYAMFSVRGPHVQHKIDVLQAGNAQKNLNLKQISNLVISIPPLSEQKKIAEILSSVDEQIQTEETKMKELQQVKKGLMQDLLTGEVRVC